MRFLPTQFSLRSPAKINLFLQVQDRQSDGYHRICSLMQMIGLYDQIDFRKLKSQHDISFRVKGRAVCAGEDNLIVKAARAFFKQYGISEGVEIVLSKQIPVSAGLGGGSGNAAATLKALSRLFGIHPSTHELISLGRSIGSDVPFFLYGPAALIQGTGEDIFPLTPNREGWVVLVDAGVSVSTAWAYRELDRSRLKRKGKRPNWNGKLWLTLLKDQHKMASRSRRTFRLEKLPLYLHNDLEEVTAKAHPVIEAIKDGLRSLGARGVLMSGSGPTVFGLFLQFRDAQRVAKAVREDHKDWKVWAARILRRAPF